MTEPSGCRHGMVRGDVLARRVNLIMDDLNIIENNLLEAVPSRKVEKKARARIQKNHRHFISSAAGGKSSFIANMYGMAAKHILKGDDMDMAFYFCCRAIAFQLRIWNQNNHTEKELLVSLEKIRTQRGLILHVASRIACGCLDEKKREAKAKPRVAHCGGCNEEKPFEDCMQCSGCKTMLYCSEDCHRKDWKQHKATCRKMGRMDYMKELKEKESG